MQRILLEKLALLVMLICLITPTAPSQAVKPGTRPQRFSAETLDGRRFTFAGYENRVVLISFWASWCAPCREEFSEVQRLHEEFRGRGFELISVDEQDERSAALEFLSEQHATSLILNDTGGQIARGFGVDSVPAYVLIDRGGKVAARGTGACEQTIPALRQEIERLTATAPRL